MPLAIYSEPEFDLPHPPISIACFLIVEDAVCAAWELLKSSPPPGFDLAGAEEVAINDKLHETLKDKIWRRGVVDGFDDELIRTIYRAEVRNYNGKRLSKRPDIIVELVDIPARVRPSQYGIFIECKPVDSDHSLVTHYCDRGIVRFVEGDYAWAMTQALFIGYVDSDLDPMERLRGALIDRQSTALPIGEATTCAFSRAPLRVFTTEHQRSFCYVEDGQPAPPIRLRHLWLRR